MKTYDVNAVAEFPWADRCIIFDLDKAGLSGAKVGLARVATTAPRRGLLATRYRNWSWPQLSI